jgi:hypothetical protein
MRTIPKEYRKKPVVIEAWRWVLPIAPSHEQALDMAWDNAQELARWCDGKATRDAMPGNERKTYYWSLEIPTLEGIMSARLGDFIIRGVNGEFYPCKPDLFAKTYEAVE